MKELYKCFTSSLVGNNLPSTFRHSDSLALLLHTNRPQTSAFKAFKNPLKKLKLLLQSSPHRRRPQVCMRESVCVCVCVSACMCVCVCVYVCARASACTHSLLHVNEQTSMTRTFFFLSFFDAVRVGWG